RVQVARDLGELLGALMGGDGLYTVFAAAALEQIDRAHADRAGRPQDGDATDGGLGPPLFAALRLGGLHSSPYHEATGGGIQSAVCDTDHSPRRRGSNEAIKPIHQA